MNSPSLQTQTRAHQDPSAPSDSIESLESKTSETERSTLSMHPPTPPSTQKKKSSDLKNQCFSSAITLKKYSAPHKHPPSLLKSSRAGQPSYKAQQQSQSVASVASQIQPPPYYRPAPFQQGLTTCTSHSQPSRSFVEPNNFSGQQDPYGMHGLLRALQVADTDWNLLALGLDLSTLGLNFNSTE
ncbi:hypothetical protein Zmor_004488 [Zophobas morio]|jgi:hypothetical protein|uniref:Uncharacterized protein n=1 Tax=Zophobas morio TaxID=2755281 RepID=A0AA38HKF4_9CUCU|nr:hypothetical protein Zmor_004488 [Zophobas morio]